MSEITKQEDTSHPEPLGIIRAKAEGWTDIHGGDTGAYWRGINPVTRRVEKLPKRYTDHI